MEIALLWILLLVFQQLGHEEGVWLFLHISAIMEIGDVKVLRS